MYCDNMYVGLCVAYCNYSKQLTAGNTKLSKQAIVAIKTSQASLKLEYPLNMHLGIFFFFWIMSCFWGFPKSCND